MHCPSLSPPSESDAYQVLYVFYKLSTHIHHHGAPDVLMPGLPPSPHTQTPPVTLESSFCHIPPTFMRLQALHCVEHVGRGGPSAIPMEHVGLGGPSAIPVEHVGCRGPSAIPMEHRDMEDPLQSPWSTWDSEDPLQSPSFASCFLSVCSRT